MTKRMRQVLCHKHSQATLLGVEACNEFDLLRVNVDAICSLRTEKNDSKWTDKLADVFEGYGKFPGKITFKVGPKVPPVQMPLRRMPIVQTRVKNEFQQLERHQASNQKEPLLSHEIP